MKAKDRHSRILDILRAMQRVVMVGELSEILKVSPLTIRRDFQVLVDQKAIIRTHGGCMIAGKAVLETEYHKKVALNFDFKQSIGSIAAAEINPGEVILIDDGSTTFHMVTHLGKYKPLSVYTNSLALITEFSRFPEIKLNILGGTVNSNQYSVSGGITEQVIESIKFDKVFLGVDAISTSGKCYVNNDGMARMSQIMIRSGKKVYLLGDHTKIGASGIYTFGTLSDFDQWITSKGIPSAQLKHFKTMTNIVTA